MKFTIPREFVQVAVRQSCFDKACFDKARQRTAEAAERARMRKSR